ncbi:hypothetical protein TNCV_913611 [Trichonephila clavipes]|nr:hypothetical protein TNCV_913611 [Trichonephila clavipes]
MSARHHLNDCDHGRAVGRLEAGQSVTTIAVAMGVSKSVTSRLKTFKVKVEWLWGCLPGSRGRSTTSLEDCYIAPRGKKEQKFHFWLHSCKVCNCYRYAYFNNNHLTAIKSIWFVCMEACSLYPISVTPSSREIMLVNAASQDFLFMDDNALSHRSVEEPDTPQSENILRLQWPVYCVIPYGLWVSSLHHPRDLNALGHPTPYSARTQNRLRQEWDNIPQGVLDSLVKSMEKRFKMCISVRRQHASY